MPQTTTVTGGEDEQREPRIGDLVIGMDENQVYMVIEIGQTARWIRLRYGTSHPAGDMEYRRNGRPYWRIAGPGERVVLEA